MLKRSASFIGISLFLLLGTTPGKDTITEINLSVLPKTAKIRPNETAIIRAEFFGIKKKGFFENLLGNSKAKKSRIQSGKWVAFLTSKKSGWLSKPFLFQKDGEKTKSGFGNFIKQGLGVASSKDSVLFTAPGVPGKYRITVTEGKLKKEVTIEVSDSAIQTDVRSQIGFLPPSKSNDPYFYLAEHFAPFIAQETWFNPKADYLTRFNYDGNWRGDDNWENLQKGSSQAVVYYTVMETKTHWFLQYNFFHARDYSDVCIVGTCHENDNEGIILTVRKDQSKYGKLEVVETLAHNNIYSFTNDRRIKKRVHDIDGKLELYNNVRPIVFIEAGGHGVFGTNYKASLFSSQTMKFKGNTGVTYVYKGKAETPKHSNDRNVGYELLPIYDELWKRGAKETQESTETFDNFYVYQPFGNRPQANAKFIAGAFKGKTASDNGAKPFWAWRDGKTRKKKLLNTGQWALDPAYAISISLKFPSNKPVSTDYVYNPYLALEKH